MYLKEISASGFKSFADKLSIKLDDKITCIVGPNGSGKSNVVDAVRWVLGEQSVKSLRGDGSMSDVIFSGSGSRNPLNVAYVELVFDNSDKYINVPYTEISIKRKVYRSGENEYSLNNEKCRLKDIINLLLDTGIGRDSFNIISQGEVQRIFSSSSYDRRVILEEAAGILKYKKRKEEALRKLDRTNNNIDRVNDIINELEVQVEPLREQSTKAREYLENKEGLEKYEIGVLAYDIEDISLKEKDLKEKQDKISKELSEIEATISTNDATDEQDNNKLIKLEKELDISRKELLTVVEEVEKLNGERVLLKERSSNKDSTKAVEELREVLEAKGSITTKIDISNNEIKILKEKQKHLEEIVRDVNNNINKFNLNKDSKNKEYSSLDRELSSLKYNLSNLERDLESNAMFPSSVRKVLNNPRLTGVFDTIGNIIDVEKEYADALDIAIASSKSFVITKDESSSIDAINYLKREHLGRATFFPLTTIKSRFVDDNTLNSIMNDEDFIDVLSNLVTYDKLYKNIILNQIGTVLVSRDIDSANRLAKKINNRYKIVTLSGDVIHVGGSFSGGSKLNSKSSISLKQDITRTTETIKNKELDLNLTLELIKNLEQDLKEENDKLFNLSHEKVELNETLITKNNELKNLISTLEELTNKEKSLKSLTDNKEFNYESELIEKYHEKVALKEKLTANINNLSKKIEDLKQVIDERNATQKLKNSSIRTLEKELNELEVTINRYDVKLDNMLNILNEEYFLTFEKAKSDYTLDLEADTARSLVNKYRSNIKKLGMVNLAAIEEFDRVSTRYEFLLKQKEDLNNALNTLLEIMNEMDEVMKEEFENTFYQVRDEFKKVFTELFKGGSADLKLTDPDNMLTTGVEIIASPPGKKLKTISLLSGGEKSLTAICLLFAIINVRKIPFCLFDEVEAALDEANVCEFGKYLNNYKDKTQFLIITHKKKTMEYADTLYGITMQESGVSKLVSVKLNNKTETI